MRSYGGRQLLVGDGNEGEEIAAPDTEQADVPLDYVAGIGEQVAHRMPAFGEAGLAASWTGVYDVTPDWNPVLGALPGVDGLQVAYGFSGHGFKLSPIVGRLVAQSVLGLPTGPAARTVCARRGSPPAICSPDGTVRAPFPERQGSTGSDGALPRATGESARGAAAGDSAYCRVRARARLTHQRQGENRWPSVPVSPRPRWSLGVAFATVRTRAGSRVLRHRHRRHRRHLLSAGRHARAAHLEQGDDRRQEALRDGRDVGRIGRERAAPRAEGHRERVRRGGHPRRRVQRQGPVRGQARQEPARAGRALSGAGAARDARERERAGLQGPQGQVGVVGFAGVGPVAAAGRPARGARHDAQGHRRGPVVVHAIGRQDQGRQPRRVADHRRRADVVDQRPRQRARRPHRAAGRARRSRRCARSSRTTRTCSCPRTRTRARRRR